MNTGDPKMRQTDRRGLKGRQMLDFLEAMIWVSYRFPLLQWEQNYKRLAKSSSEVTTPKDKATVAQILANAEFSQNELGIRTGWSELCWRCIQPINKGKAKTQRQRITMVAGSLMRWTSVLMML